MRQLASAALLVVGVYLASTVHSGGTAIAVLVGFGVLALIPWALD